MKLEDKKKPYFGEHHYSPRKLIRALSEHPTVQAALEKYPPEKSRIPLPGNPVSEYLKEIIATPSTTVVDGLRRSLRLLWYRIFNGLEVQGLAELKQQIDGKQVIYLPCHRSHLDYLLLSYVLDQEYMILPHIIAGNNLNLTGVGKVLKGGGAVFIRRSFRNNPLYATCFVTYLNYLLDHKFPIEVFIEGGRSRTGKNLPPKIGIIAVLIEYHLQNPDKDLYFVPVSFTYERIPEENAYLKELNGGVKQQENLFELLNAYKVLKKNFGKVFVSFAPALSLAEMLSSYVATNALTETPPVDSEAFKEMAYSFGMTVMDQINLYTRTSALPVVATALLSEKHRGFHRRDLLEKSQFLVDVYQAVHPRAQATLVESEGGLDGLIEFLLQGGTVQCIKDPDEDIYYFQSKDKIRLNLYKNVFLHHFVIPSIIAMKLQQETHTREELLEYIRFFDNLLRYEFMFPRAYNFTEAVDTMLRFALQRALIVETEGRYAPNPQKVAWLNLLANILLPFIEAFYVAIRVLTSKKAAFPLEIGNLVSVFRDNHQKFLLLGKISSIEGNLTVTYKNIVRFFIEEDIIVSQQDRDKRAILRKSDGFPKIYRLYEQLFADMEVLVVSE
jgi:glycerol-3-phosphate O-acyltransferase